MAGRAFQGSLKRGARRVARLVSALCVCGRSGPCSADVEHDCDDAELAFNHLAAPPNHDALRRLGYLGGE